MKITGGLNDANHWRNHFATCPVVLFDGARIDHVCEADDAEGYVIVEVRENGRPKPNAAGDSIERQRLTGNVEFIGERHSRGSE